MSTIQIYYLLYTTYYFGYTSLCNNIVNCIFIQFVYAVDTLYAYIFRVIKFGFNYIYVYFIILNKISMLKSKYV